MSVLNSQTVGFERVCREFFGALCSPMNAINRIISGQMWKRAPAPKYYKKIPVTADVQMGLRLLSDKYSTEFSGYIDLKYK